MKRSMQLLAAIAPRAGVEVVVGVVNSILATHPNPEVAELPQQVREAVGRYEEALRSCDIAGAIDAVDATRTNCKHLCQETAKRVGRVPFGFYEYHLAGVAEALGNLIYTTLTMEASRGEGRYDETREDRYVYDLIRCVGHLGTLGSHYIETISKELGEAARVSIETLGVAR